jgi:hypothetical protein
MVMRLRGLGTVFWVSFFLTACTGGWPGINGAPAAPAGETAATETPLVPTNTPFLPTDSAVPATDTPTDPPKPASSVWFSPTLPPAFRLSFRMPAGWLTADKPEESTVQLSIGGDRLITTWIYALVAPFATVADGTTSEELSKQWSQGSSYFRPGRPLEMDQNTLDVLSAFWGNPAPGAVQVLPAGELADAVWNSRPAWAIIPWEAMEPRWKMLELDGLSPLRKDFDPTAYALAVPISCAGAAELCGQIAGAVSPAAGNRNPAELTTLVMTGVTALVRATATTMEARGILYPAQDIGPTLQSADLTHISNEIPFSQDCPPPDPTPGMYRFCSDPRYIDLLEYIGTDIVELTGNHVLDYGVGALLYTLDLYRQRGWQYYASGENLQAARLPIQLEHNGNRLAFIGCNRVGYNGEWATDTTPGAAPCDFDYLIAEIGRLKSAGYLPIMSFQYFEYYHLEPTQEQAEEFARMAAAGAVIVSGSQAHRPQGFALAGETFIHYGLGNLFFDQIEFGEGTNTAFIDRHVFYSGRYIGTDILTIQFVDYARPRFMKPDERAALLSAAFTASGW